MPDSRPELVAIDHDDYHAEHVGTTADGRQFFLTAPFEPGVSEYLALYLFDEHGELLEALVDDLGPRASLDRAARTTLSDERLAEIGPVSHGRIEVAPFSVSRFGLEFGLVARRIDDEHESDDDEPVDDDDTEWTVEVMPGNYMAFWAPWDDGGYDT